MVVWASWGLPEPLSVFIQRGDSTGEADLSLFMILLFLSFFTFESWMLDSLSSSWCLSPALIALISLILSHTQISYWQNVLAPQWLIIEVITGTIFGFSQYLFLYIMDIWCEAAECWTCCTWTQPWKVSIYSEKSTNMYYLTFKRESSENHVSPNFVFISR